MKLKMSTPMTITVVAVSVDDSMVIQGGDPTTIQGLIQQLESTLEAPKMLNH
jgi:hypothetical protein